MSTSKVSFYQDHPSPSTAAVSDAESSLPTTDADVVSQPTTTKLRLKLSLNKEKIAAHYKKYCALLKSFLLQYLQYISSPARQEAILKTTQYTLWLLSRFYQGKNSNKTSNFVESLAELSGELSWARYVLRFFGLPAAMEGVNSGSWASETNLGKAMAWTMVFYYPLEHLAYLAWKAPMTRWIPSNASGVAATRWNPFGAKSSSSASSDSTSTCSSSELMTSSQIAGKASAWSCRFWFAYLVLDIARSMLALQKVQQSNSNSTDSDNDKKKPAMNGDQNSQDDENQTTELTPAQTSLIRTERLQLVRNFLYLLPAIHWSLPNWDTKPWLSNDVVNGLCWLEAVVTVYQGIRNFREQ